MTTDIPPNWRDPAPGTTWTDILPDYKFPPISIRVRGILRDIKEDSVLTPELKKKWIRAIASIFEEDNIQDIIYNDPLDLNMLNSKIKEAEKTLSEVVTDSKYDMKKENEKIIDYFTEFIFTMQQSIHRET
ncbi:MAG: hypothetical protein AAGU10_08165 [Methanosarcina mazei]